MNLASVIVVLQMALSLLATPNLVSNPQLQQQALLFANQAMAIANSALEQPPQTQLGVPPTNTPLSISTSTQANENSYGTKAPAGMEYDGHGNLVPITNNNQPAQLEPSTPTSTPISIYATAQPFDDGNYEVKFWEQGISYPIVFTNLDYQSHSVVCNPPYLIQDQDGNPDAFPASIFSVPTYTCTLDLNNATYTVQVHL